MEVGGAEYSKDAARAVRVISVTITPILAIYAILIIVGAIPSTHHVSVPITLSISVLWVLMSLLYFVKPAATMRDQGLRIVTIHFFAIMTLMFVTGFMQPFAPLFTLLFLASYLFFSRVGLTLSILSLVLAAAADAFLRH